MHEANRELTWASTAEFLVRFAADRRGYGGASRVADGSAERRRGDTRNADSTDATMSAFASIGAKALRASSTGFLAALSYQSTRKPTRRIRS
ncbi:MAG: hypothetical protein RJA21_314 [Gemmatimonadota bacterium]|jgi:hypothetical protein